MSSDRAGVDRHAAVVYNPVKADAAKLRPSVERASAAAGFSATEWFETTPDDAGQQATRRALAGGASVVIAAGGDGTVRAVAEVLRGSGVPLGLVPSGTGNLLARNLDIPLSSPDAAVRLAFTGADRAIDIGVATLTPASGGDEEHCFLVMAGLGIDAAMIANTSSTLKAKVGWLAYVDGTMRSLPSLEKVRLRYRIAGEPQHTAHVSTILIANCSLLPGNIELIPDTMIDDGLLDLAVLQPNSLFGWLMIWRRITWENRVLRRTSLGRSIIRLSGGEKRSTITYLRGESVRLGVDRPQPFELDGDSFGEVTAAHLAVDAGALVVRVAHPAISPAPRRPASHSRASVKTSSR